MVERIRDWFRHRHGDADRNGRVSTRALVEQVDARLSDMLEAMRTERLATRKNEHSVDDLVTAFASLASQLRQQGEHNDRLATREAQSAQHRNDQLTSVIEALGDAAASQAARMEEVARNLERSGRDTDELREAVTALRETVERLAEQSTRHDETTQRLETHAGIRERALADMIEKDNKRFGTLTWLMVAALAVTMIMAIVQFRVLMNVSMPR
jgi:methyl-accepting chemotaxis protein